MIKKLTNWYFTSEALPYWCILCLDCILVILSGYLAIYIVDSAITVTYFFWEWMRFWLCSLIIFITFMHTFHTYQGIIRYSNFTDLIRIELALGISTAILFVICLFLPESIFGVCPKPKHLIYMLFFSSMFMMSTRIAAKYIYDILIHEADMQNVLIFGTRLGGISIAKSLRSMHPVRYNISGFISDDENIVGRFLLGAYVYSTNNVDLINIIRQKNIEALFVSPLCNEHVRNNQELINSLLKSGIRIMMMPEAMNWDGSSELNITQLREVEIEDLLPRDKIEIDIMAVGKMLQGQTILITGAAGSIGSEMVRQIAEFDVKNLILIDQAETPMHDIRRYIAKEHVEINCKTIVSSICNSTHMEEIFATYRPDYVFHAAAYKHVPMMENNPAIAVQNNIYGTRVIANLAIKYGTKKFVMISTDKAVNPTNVMGCSKRICEIYCQTLNKSIQEERCPISTINGDKPHTQFVTTRFGNVLGSNGSVIPIFREQIKRGGPVTVTHPDIIRFFMLIPEACQLVLEAGTMGHGGEIFVFDMGKPVRIADLAQRMIDLSGAKNVEIEYVGLRDGEKLFEEVLNDEEQTIPTSHPKIKVARVREDSIEEVIKDEDELYELSFKYDDMAIVKKMKAIVPEYKSRHSKYESLDIEEEK